MKKIKKGVFSAALIHTQLPGIIMYRMANFANYMKTPVLMPEWDKHAIESSAWQHFVTDKDTNVMRDLHYLAENADVIIFQRFLNDRGLAVIQGIRECSKGTKKIGMEIDDYMFNVPNYNQAHGNYLPGSPLFMLGLQQMNMSDFMVVSTNKLKDYYKRDNANIFVAENCIDFKWWGKIENKNEKNKKIRIGWAGANAHLEDVRILRGVMDALLNKYGSKIEFYFYSPNGLFDDKEGLINEKGHTPLDKYPKKLKSLGFDIGLAPLCDNLFNRAKSANRYLEYSMLGIPTVASDLGGQFSEIIKDGENGFLAKTETDWINKLSELIESASVRLKVGKNAFEFVKKNYRAEVGAKKYDKLVKMAFKVRGNYEFQRDGSINSEITKTVTR
jgi:hypothetical protein